MKKINLTRKQKINAKKLIRIICYFFLFSLFADIVAIWINYSQIIGLVILFIIYIIYSELKRKELENKLLQNYHNNVISSKLRKLKENQKQFNENEKI